MPDSRLQCYSCGHIWVPTLLLVYCPNCYNSVSIGPVNPEEVARHKEWRAGLYRKELDARTRRALENVVAGHHRFSRELQTKAKSHETFDSLWQKALWFKDWFEFLTESEKAVKTLAGIEFENTRDAQLINDAARYLEHDIEIVSRIGASIDEKILAQFGNPEDVRKIFDALSRNKRRA